MSKGNLRRLAVVLVAIVVLAIVAFGPTVLSSFTKKKAAPPALATVADVSFPVVAKATGTLFPQKLTFVNFAAAGLLVEIDVKVGDAVSAGQKLARLDPSAQQAALASAQAAVGSGRASLATAYASGISQQIAAAQAMLANAEAQLQKAQFDLNSTVLTAPESATVLEVNSPVGQSVNAGVTHVPALPGSSSGIIDPVAVSTDNSAFIVLGTANAFQVSAAFDQASAARLSAGQTGTVSFDALTGLSLPGAVTVIASATTQVNGVPEYYATVSLTGTDPRLRSGMTVTVNLDIAQAQNVLGVPSQALYTLNNAEYVDVWYRGGAVPTVVTTGLIGDKFAQITSGLTAGQQVVTSPGQALTSAAPSPS